MCFGHLPQDRTAFYCSLSPPSRALEHGATQDFWTISNACAQEWGMKTVGKSREEVRGAVLIKNQELEDKRGLIESAR